MAGGAAAAAAALTLADPNAADRKPEQRTEQEKQPVEVKDQVPASAFDKLDGSAAGSGSAVAQQAKPTTDPAPAKTTAKKLPVLPTPHDAVDPNHADHP